MLLRSPRITTAAEDTAIEVLVDPRGDPVVLIHGVMASLHPDYVVVKYAAGDGTTIWNKKWGGAGEDSPRNMEIDVQGDVFVTGTGLNFRNEYSTVKLRGSDGSLVWQAFDSGGLHNGAAALTLDGVGGVYVTGTVDPDGDQSNQNDNIYSVKRNSADGAPRVVSIDGAVALLMIGGVSPGSHTVELTDPAGCFTPRTPVCPANQRRRGTLTGIGAAGHADPILMYAGQGSGWSATCRFPGKTRCLP